MKTKSITVEILRARLDYDDATDVLTWKYAVSRSIKAGQVERQYYDVVVSATTLAKNTPFPGLVHLLGD